MAARKMLDRVIPSTRQLLVKRLHRGGGCGGHIHYQRHALPVEQSSNFSHREFLMGKQQDGNEINILSNNRGIFSTNNDDHEYDVTDDFLGANKLGKKFLIRSYMDGKQPQLVPVESLRGKIVGLYCERSLQRFSLPLDQNRVTCAFREFYKTLKLTKPDSFEMIYVPPLPPKHGEEHGEEDPSVHSALISTLPWLSVPVHDLDWRSYIYRVNNHYGYDFTTDITFIDTRNDKFRVFPTTVDNIYRYGPHFYPFDGYMVTQLELQAQRYGEETSIQAILGSNSRDYLVDRHRNKVPISSLHNKDVLLFYYSSDHAMGETRCLERLLEIYKEFHNHSFEIVSINLDYNGGNEKKENLWKDHLAQIPWLSLPFGDEKIWPLRMMVHNVFEDCSDPTVFVKPKGETLLDPYGYQILNTFGIQAYPFTRMAAAEYLVARLKGLSFKSYVDEASCCGLDFSSLIRNKPNGGTEHVSMSTLLEGKARRILLLFANLETCSRERLKSLISIYNSQKGSSSPFEVIFVSIDKDTPSFNEHFSIMPWFALQRPINRREHMMLDQRTTNIDFGCYSHFLAFGPDQLLLQAGMLTKSFENCEFPFINDAESADHIAFCIAASLELKWKADGTPCYDGYGWWSGIEYKYARGINGYACGTDDLRFYDY